jgi:aspartyl-tRNA synthetase
MLRTHTCGELRITHVGQPVSLTGWVQRQRDKGSILWIDLRDRYGITQLFFEEGSTPAELMKAAKEVGREYVIQANGIVTERLSKNDKLTYRRYRSKSHRTGGVEHRQDSSLHH